MGGGEGKYGRQERKLNREVIPKDHQSLDIVISGNWTVLESSSFEAE